MKAFRVRLGISMVLAALLLLISLVTGCSVGDRVVTIAGDGQDGGAPDASTVLPDGGSVCIPGSICNPTNLSFSQAQGADHENKI